VRRIGRKSFALAAAFATSAAIATADSSHNQVIEVDHTNVPTGPTGVYAGGTILTIAGDVNFLAGASFPNLHDPRSVVREIVPGTSGPTDHWLVAETSGCRVERFAVQTGQCPASVVANVFWFWGNDCIPSPLNTTCGNTSTCPGAPCQILIPWLLNRD
jgi:hypothetical protein